jgi:hypothetical protein
MLAKKRPRARPGREERAFREGNEGSFMCCGFYLILGLQGSLLYQTPCHPLDSHSPGSKLLSLFFHLHAHHSPIRGNIDPAVPVGAQDGDPLQFIQDGLIW